MSSGSFPHSFPVECRRIGQPITLRDVANQENRHPESHSFEPCPPCIPTSHLPFLVGVSLVFLAPFLVVYLVSPAFRRSHSIVLLCDTPPRLFWPFVSSSPNPPHLLAPFPTYEPFHLQLLPSPNFPFWCISFVLSSIPPSPCTSTVSNFNCSYSFSLCCYLLCLRFPNFQTSCILSFSYHCYHLCSDQFFFHHCTLHILFH